MFDRHKIEGTHGRVSVEIKLEGGRELKGRFVVPQGRSLTDVLNSPSAFLEFDAYDGDRTFIAKAALRTVKPIDVPTEPDLWAGPTQGGSFDPFAVLGIKPGCTREDAREAYLGLAKIYHPDRYAAVDLPREVRDYLAVMVRRVNAAHDAVDGAFRQEAAKEQPIFTAGTSQTR